jgi:hypothetical protein
VRIGVIIEKVGKYVICERINCTVTMIMMIAIITIIIVVIFIDVIVINRIGFKIL